MIMADNKQNKNPNVPNLGKVPKLRFPEFSEDWAATQIGKVLKIGNGKDYKLLKEGNIPVFGTGGYMLSVDDYLYDGESVFIGRKGTINKPFYYKGKFWTVDTLFYTHSFNGVLPKFVFGLFQNINWELYNEASGVPSLSKSTIEKIKCNIPSYTEQAKISNLLFLLDERIATQNKIIEDLKKLKVAICNKYLIKGNSLRLGDIGYFVRGLSYSASDVVEDNGTAVIRSNNIINGDLLNFSDLVYVDKKSTTEQQLKFGDIVICMANGSSALVGKSSYYNGNFDGDITIGAFCGIYRSSNPIVRWLFQSNHYRKCIIKNIQGGNGAIANVYPEDILNISFDVPAYLHSISNLLLQIEDKITNENCLLNNYSQTKLYLLNNMFI